MKIKVGNEWIDPTKTPVMVVFEPKDKENISLMAPGATSYAVINGELFHSEDISKWMDDQINLPL
jgi:hypothetical protein